MHKLITLGCLLAAVAAAPVDSFAAAPRRTKTFQLRPQFAPAAKSRVEMGLEVSGENRVVEDDKIERSKMSILANVTYEERLLGTAIAAGRPVRSIRQYEKAAVLLKLGEKDELRPTLREDRRLVGIELDAPSVTLFSPHGPLTRDELDILEMHGAGMSLLAYLLLPDKPVAIDGSWKHAPELMAAMLDLDAVSETDVKSALEEVSDDTAKILMEGHVEGAVGGVSTEIELKARIHFSLSAGRITWFGMVLREDRSIGHVEGGLFATSKLQVKITPLEESAALGDAAIAGLTLTPGDAQTLLSYESPEGGWGLVHGRKWFITRDENRLAILRFVDQGEFVAQCNIQAMDDAKPEQQVAMTAFQDDIRRGLGDNFKEFLQASERAGEPDLRVYRVVAAGEVEQLPIHWIYYLVADKRGRQLVLVFTIEASLLEKFGAADEQIVAALRLDPPRESPKPTPAGQRPKAEEGESG
jgi:hypothetical protein